jgi:UDP:flavonoid glycosyltransferase YjiC (YdhE family)
VAEYGAGITLPSDRWHASTIQEAIRTVIGDPGYRVREQELAHTIHSGHGKRQAAECI